MLTVEARELVQRRGTRTVLPGLTFEVGSGAVGLLGPNGAGKTTLLETISTILVPVSGSLTVLGLSVARRRDRETLRGKLGFLPQKFGYVPSFGVRDFVEYVAWTKGLRSRHLKDAALAALKRVDLVDRQNDTMRKLSGGMRQRVGIAAAIVHFPELLVLDEPTVGLDPRQRSEFREFIRTIAADTPVLFSTHLTDDVDAMCSDVIVLDEGRVAFQGTTAELVERGEGATLGDSPTERGYNAVTSTSLDQNEDSDVA